VRNWQQHMRDRPLRVIVTHEMYLPQFAGGGEYLVARTAQELAKRNVEVRVITTGNPAVTSHAGVPTHRIRIPRHAFAAAIPEIMRAALEADLIQTFNYNACLPSLIAGRRAKKPVVCLFLAIFGDFWKDSKGAIIGRAYMALERYMVRQQFDKSIFLGSYSHEMALALGAPADSEIVSIAIDLENFKPAERKENSVIFTGKYENRKGVFDVLAVARRLPQVKFRMMGWGPEERKLRAEAPANVEFLPYDHGAPLSEALGKAAIFLLPSRAEAFPIALAQAMASGCAVLFTKPLAFAGSVIAPGDINGIAHQVNRLWSNPEETARRGRENLSLARGFSWEEYSSKLIAIYNNVLRRGTRSGTSWA
jgi:glycosyltransferase involved in cell wall biosynthesis